MTRHILTIEIEGSEYGATDTLDLIEEAIATAVGDELPLDYATRAEYLLGRQFSGEDVWIRVRNQ